jgi:hypothetical protein
MLIVLGMLKSAVLAHFKTNVAVAGALGISEAAVSQWGSLVPPAQARRLHILTDGTLPYDPDDYKGCYPEYRFLPPAVEAR